MIYQFLRDFGPGAVGVAAVIIAGMGLSTWRRQLRDRISVERAVSFLDSAHDYAQSVALMMSLADTYRSNKLYLVRPSSPQREKAIWEHATADVGERQQAMQDAQARLLSEWARVQVWWGHGVLKDELGQLMRTASRAIEEITRGMVEPDDSYHFPYADDGVVDEWWREVYTAIELMRKGFGKEFAWYLIRK